MPTPSCRQITRRKAGLRYNRYNPNKPDWRAVHVPWWMAPVRTKKSAA
jgi:hypothetical protein